MNKSCNDSVNNFSRRRFSHVLEVRLSVNQDKNSQRPRNKALLLPKRSLDEIDSKQVQFLHEGYFTTNYDNHIIKVCNELDERVKTRQNRAD